MDVFILIAIALLGVIIAWKFLKGIVKTIALAAILVVAAAFVFGV